MAILASLCTIPGNKLHTLGVHHALSTKIIFHSVGTAERYTSDDNVSVCPSVCLFVCMHAVRWPIDLCMDGYRRMDEYLKRQSYSRVFRAHYDLIEIRRPFRYCFTPYTNIGQDIYLRSSNSGLSPPFAPPVSPFKGGGPKPKRALSSFRAPDFAVRRGASAGTSGPSTPMGPLKGSNLRRSSLGLAKRFPVFWLFLATEAPARKPSRIFLLFSLAPVLPTLGWTPVLPCRTMLLALAVPNLPSGRAASTPTRGALRRTPAMSRGRVHQGVTKGNRREKRLSMVKTLAGLPQRSPGR